MTFSAQRYDFRLRPPPAARISVSSRNKQEELYIETGSVWLQSLGRISLISSTAVSVSTNGGRGFEWNSWVRQFDITRRKVVRYSYVTKRRCLNRFSLIWRGTSQLLRGCKMNVPR
ncbi:hypothetical protein AGABI2DRAFT_176917 [Agaricus bisporus var. bisporus H97]|uniref:hypothetical protein n=1 Tax=Agaricus bisporus var. bisporus (strain H97 / ATCC MYA-4626 / FGSC 10389) TaxID=936046 RepID=UPI00029F6EDA|nr:hypothetical protein AGABI2DRAFT_176917 [Agaricus bisporus var. bisporus H97]EKV50619.1 hypothetical protein AGABI2DRAFT_176917 [Agaricus bisporus var. bisporus H97]